MQVFQQHLITAAPKDRKKELALVLAVRRMTALPPEAQLAMARTIAVEHLRMTEVAETELLLQKLQSRADSCITSLAETCLPSFLRSSLFPHGDADSNGLLYGVLGTDRPGALSFKNVLHRPFTRWKIG